MDPTSVPDNDSGFKLAKLAQINEFEAYRPKPTSRGDDGQETRTNLRELYRNFRYAK
jgi:hypothetical protein